MGKQTKNNNVEVLKVAGSSNVKNLAGAVANVVSKKNTCEMIAVGAAAVNQAVKALIVARIMVSSDGYTLDIIPAFHTVSLTKNSSGEESEVTAIKFIVNAVV